MTFWHQLSLLWLLAWAALAFFTLSVCWLIISAAWRLSREESENIKEELKLWKAGGADAPLIIPPEKSTAFQVAKMMLLLAVILGAYDLGIKVNYTKEYAAWKAQRSEYLRLYAAWAARQPKENK